MKKIAILLFTISAALDTQAQSVADSDRAIKWSQSHLLSDSDFQAPVPQGTSWAALTSSNIYFSFQTRGNKLSSFNVYATFDPGKSWMKKDTPTVLQHEQLHFDITEVYARKLFAELKPKTGSATASQLREIFARINKEWGDTQERYDDETAHGVIVNEQRYWQEKVKTWLQEYEKYPATE